MLYCFAFIPIFSISIYKYKQKVNNFSKREDKNMKNIDQMTKKELASQITRAKMKDANQNLMDNLLR